MIDCEYGSCRWREDVSDREELKGCYDHKSPDSPYQPITKKLVQEVKKEIENCPGFQRLKVKGEPAWDGDTDPNSMFKPTALFRFLSGGKREIVIFCPYSNQDLLDE